MMREVMELTTEEICKALAITPTNLAGSYSTARVRTCANASQSNGLAEE